VIHSDFRLGGRAGNAGNREFGLYRVGSCG